MPLPSVELDDRTFEQLQSELRRRIPAYSPEWTDHNDSDPGITLLQLFAYLSEMIIWRLNRVPSKNYYAFLRLLDIELNLPVPAKAELTFTLSAKTLGFAVPVPAGTQARLGSGGGTHPVVFETDETILVVGFTLAQVQVYDGARFTVVTADQRAPGKSFDALSGQPQRDAALYLGFDGVFPDGQHRLTIHAAAAGATPVVQTGADLDGSTLPPVSGQWEFYAGDQAGWQALTGVSDGTNCLTRSGLVQFAAPPAGAHVAARLGALQRPSDAPLYWIRYRIGQVLGDGYESPPVLEDVLLNTVSATNAVAESMEMLGASNGLPGQTFSLANVPVLPKPADVPGIIAVDEGDGNGYVTWSEVADFSRSGPSDKVYTIALSTGLVTFGDGVNGKVPGFVSSDGSNTFASDAPNVMATRYQWGGGASGNAGANTITALDTVIPYVDSVTNLRPAAGGQDEETVEEACARVPAFLRSQDRAVTSEDFATIAMATPGAHIVRAQALPLYNPTLSVPRVTAAGTAAAVAAEVPLPGVVTVVVIPYSTDPKPVPSAATLQLVAAQLDRHRLVTTEVYVTAPAYRKVEIRVGVIADPRSLIATVTSALTARLLAYFHPVTGGSGATGWDFGETIYASETMREILVTQGVLRIVANSFQTYVDDVLCSGDVAIGPAEVVYSVQHTVMVSYS
jgi:predicted phage baseplate assembly protein